jgi:hypothetical protein
MEAMMALQVIGVRGSAAIPELGKHLGRMETVNAAAAALLEMGPQGTDRLVQELTSSPESPGRGQVIANLAKTRYRTDLVMPALVRCLADPNLWEKGMAVQALGILHAEPTIAVPALAGMLRDQNPSIRLMATSALANFGTNASSAVPALVKVWEADPGASDGRQAADLLAQIAPAVAGETRLRIRTTQHQEYVRHILDSYEAGKTTLTKFLGDSGLASGINLDLEKIPPQGIDLNNGWRLFSMQLTNAPQGNFQLTPASIGNSACQFEVGGTLGDSLAVLKFDEGRLISIQPLRSTTK